MRRRRAVLATLIILAVLAGCGGDDEPMISATSVAATTVTTRPAAALKAALLSPADVPGSKASRTPSGDVDDSACFPGNPLGAKTDPNEVDGPDLEVSQGRIERQYSSSARQATPEQAAAYVATLLTPAGSECVVSVLKTDFASDPTPPKVDASGLTGRPATKVPIGDGGAVLSIRGSLKAEGSSIRAEADLVAFHKGPIIVFLLVGAQGGPVVSGQGVELAQKVAARLT